jgi:hypothetical protein
LADEALCPRRLRTTWGCYILGVVMIDSDRLESVRSRISNLNAGHPIHASDLYSIRNFELLESAISLVANDHDNADILYASPLADDDKSGEKTRQRCLASALVAIQGEFGSSIFVLDSRRLKDADTNDRRTANDLRKAGLISRNTRLIHLWPTEEILLSCPDVLAWSYRQTITKNEPRWFSLLASEVRVTLLSPN